MLIQPHLLASAEQAIRAAIPMPLLDSLLPQIVRAAHVSAISPPTCSDHRGLEQDGKRFVQPSGDFAAGRWLERRPRLAANSVPSQMPSPSKSLRLQSLSARSRPMR
jgi:hypothetical protein